MQSFSIQVVLLKQSQTCFFVFLIWLVTIPIQLRVNAIASLGQYTVRGIKKLSSTGAGADTGTDTGAIDNT